MSQRNPVHGHFIKQTKSIHSTGGVTSYWKDRNGEIIQSEKGHSVEDDLQVLRMRYFHAGTIWVQSLGCHVLYAPRW